MRSLCAGGRPDTRSKFLQALLGFRIDLQAIEQRVGGAWVLQALHDPTLQKAQVKVLCGDGTFTDALTSDSTVAERLVAAKAELSSEDVRSYIPIGSLCESHCDVRQPFCLLDQGMEQYSYLLGTARSLMLTSDFTVFADPPSPGMTPYYLFAFTRHVLTTKACVFRVCRPQCAHTFNSVATLTCTGITPIVCSTKNAPSLRRAHCYAKARRCCTTKACVFCVCRPQCAHAFNSAAAQTCSCS